jgi:predicted unusual protein kinase regulating ubiquinone biosynthesis (AarF/ABC1/UbiB family)
LGIAGRATLGLGKRITGKSAEDVAAETQRRTAEQLFSVLGQLKGGAMKFGQAMSIFEAALPDEVAGPYREALTKLQEGAPPMKAETVDRVMTEQFGRRWRTRFTEFDDEPAAAASIGQVHHAVWADGREVAVKLQYPGAGPALMADFNQLSRFSRLFALMSPGMDVKPLLAELKARIAEELDYALEADSQRGFQTAFDSDPNILVPRMVASAPKVLVSEWIEGIPVARIITSGTTEQRDRASPARPAALLGAGTGPDAARRPPPGELPADARRPARRRGFRRRGPAAGRRSRTDRADDTHGAGRRHRVGGRRDVRRGIHPSWDRDRPP